MNLYLQDFMESTRVRYYVYAVSYHLVWQIDYGIFHRPIMALTQILIQSWEPRTRISVLFRKRT